MATGKISVELRLVLDKLNADIKAAAASMRAGLGKDMGSTAAGTEKAANAQTKLAGEVKKTTNALKDQARASKDAVAAILSGKGYPGQRPFNINSGAGVSSGVADSWSTDAGGGLATSSQGKKEAKRKREFDKEQIEEDARIRALKWEQSFQQTFDYSRGKEKDRKSYQDFWATGAGAQPPVIPPPKIPVSILDMLKGGNFKGAIKSATSGGLSSPLAIAAQLGAALAGLRVAIGLAKFAFGAIIVPIKTLERAFAEAAESARRLYAKSLQSGGLGIGFVARRALLADAIGVSEEEVFSYGKAVSYLNSQLAFATSVAAGTNTSLTATAWSLRVVQEDFKALASVLAFEMSGTVRLMARAFHQLAVEIAPIMAIIGKVLRTGLLTAMTMAATALGPAIAVAFARIAAKAGFGEDAPTPEVSTRRMPISAWEKMGLVIGSGGVNDFAKQTAANTRKTVEKLERVVEILGGSAVPRFMGTPNFNLL
jgi:hypothetical protein